MRTKKIYVLWVIITLLLIGVVGCRVYYVNKGIAREFKKDEYKVGDEVQLDNLNIKLISTHKEKQKFNEEYKIDTITYKAKFRVKVTSKIDKDLKIFANETFMKKSMPTKNYEFSKSVESLKVGNTVDVTITWDYEPEFFKDKKYIDIYIPKQLYSKEIRGNFKEGFMYGKYIRTEI